MKGGGAEMVVDSVGGLCCTEIQEERQTGSDGGRHYAPAYGALSLCQNVAPIKIHRFNTTRSCDFSSLYLIKELSHTSTYTRDQKVWLL